MSRPAAGTTATDELWMARAIALAERARMHAAPNPHVGCVLVRDGRLLAEGWTRPPGGAHAEVVALEAVRGARGATAYVTLEPCNHVGRTGPCSDALVTAGVDRVVLGTHDPNPVAAGGAERLRTAGIQVTEGVLAPWVARQLAPTLTTAVTGRPHVTLKLAQTVDGSLVGPARWITGSASRRVVHRLRARSDAVLVGSGTVLADDPRLDVRDVAVQRGQPRVVVLDGRGRTPPDAAVVREGTIVVTADGTDSWSGLLTSRGVAVRHVAPAGDDGGVALDAALAVLHEAGIQSVLAEPGERLAGALLDAGVVDRVVRHVATSVRATDGRPRIVGVLAGTVRWPLVRHVQRGTDVELVTEPP